MTDRVIEIGFPTLMGILFLALVWVIPTLTRNAPNAWNGVRWLQRVCIFVGIALLALPWVALFFAKKAGTPPPP